MKNKKELVENLLKKNTEGLTIEEISEKLEMSRNTISIALAELKGEGRIKVRQIGMAKLHYLK
jgi:DNA-binding transcriptional regulator GbsR (MarR family)